jgi:hypothetical protein
MERIGLERHNLLCSGMGDELRYHIPEWSELDDPKLTVDRGLAEFGVERFRLLRD